MFLIFASVSRRATSQNLAEMAKCKEKANQAQKEGKIVSHFFSVCLFFQ